MSTHPSDFSIRIACACSDCGGGGPLIADWSDLLERYPDHLSFSFVGDFRGSECGARRVEIDRLIKRTLSAFGVRDHRRLVGVSGPLNSLDQ